MKNKKYHTNSKIVETEGKRIPMAHIHDHSQSFLDTHTSIKKSGGVKLVEWEIFCLISQSFNSMKCTRCILYYFHDLYDTHVFFVSFFFI
jgi:hypothetical protein